MLNPHCLLVKLLYVQIYIAAATKCILHPAANTRCLVYPGVLLLLTSHIPLGFCLQKCANNEKMGKDKEICLHRLLPHWLQAYRTKRFQLCSVICIFIT